jgi:capsular polysaccharide transport system permease protein
MLDKLPQARSARRLPFLPEPPSAPAAAATPTVAPASSHERRRPQRQRRRVLLWSLGLLVLLPTALASIYFGLIASDQFVVEVRFAVRSSNGVQSGDALSLFGAIPNASSTVTDSYIVIDYLQSRELVDKLNERIGLRKIYARPEADYLSRFDDTLSVEEFVKYWRKMLKAGFDVASQVVAVEVRAFTAEDAKKVATALLELSEELINEISARARADSVRSSQQEVRRMEDLLRSHRGALRSFRDTQQEFDPTKQAEARYSLLGKLEEALSQAKTKLGNLRSFMGKDAPSVLVLNSEIASLERQVAEERAKLGKDEATAARGRETLGGLVANYEELVVDREFAEKAYVSALSSLERARVEADRQQRYVAAFVRPTLPEEALYPRRIVASITVFAVALVLWALGVLIVYAIRDHAL